MEGNIKDDKYELMIWKNGKRADSCFKIVIPKNISSIQTLKEYILSSNHLSNIMQPEKIRLFNQKGLELEELDLPYLPENPLIYISFNNKQFSNMNYHNQYKILQPINKGGFAQVFLGENVLTHKLVAIKKTDIKNFSTDELYNLSREGRLISNLVHPNIIKINCFYTNDNYLYNVMEYAKGGELTQLINSKKPIPESQIKNIFKQIHSAVNYLHNRNIIHRDLKPNNIVFLDEEKTNVAIIDFGISSNVSGGDVLKAGTLKYLPPEAFLVGDFKNSTEIDMWAMGIILYLLNFKCFPFDGKTSSEIKNKIFFEQVSYPKNIKIRKSLINLIDNLLNKDYKKRITCADESFAQYFNDNNMNKDAFICTKVLKSKSTKTASLKVKQVKILLEKIQNNIK